MKQLRRILLLAWAALAGSAAFTGCSSDGGVVGSGISSVSGNVVQVELSSPEEGSAATAAPATVSVSIDEAPGVETLTANDGSFLLEGDFSGEVTLRFRTADRATDLATRALHVPEGAALVLDDVGVAPGVVEVSAERVVEFRGEIESTDCAAGKLVVVDDSRRGNRFELLLIDETEIVARDGAALACTDLQPHDRVLVEHGVPDETTGQLTVLRMTASPAPPNGPPHTIPIHLRGHAIDVNCTAGHIRIDDERLREHRARVEFNANTSFVCDGTACACEDVQPGDGLAIEGVIFANDARVIRAIRIDRHDPPDVIRVKVAGPIVAKDCERGGFLVHDPRFSRVEIAVRVLPATVFECSGRPDLPCDCEGLRLREFVAVDGILRDLDASPLVDAERVRVRRGAGPPPTHTRRPTHTARPTRTPRG